MYASAPPPSKSAEIRLLVANDLAYNYLSADIEGKLAWDKPRKQTLIHPLARLNMSLAFSSCLVRETSTDRLVIAKIRSEG